MKKFLVLSILMVYLNYSTLSVSAEKRHKHDSQGMEQFFDNFMLEQFQDEIVQALKEFYKNDSISYVYNWWDKSYDVVEIEGFRPNRNLSHRYIVRFTVLTYENKVKGKRLGQDTVTFGVSPLLFNKEMSKRNLAASKVKFLSIKHSKPPK
ncbi:DUF3888 domain-containing protein [Gottfriedia sp. NPDC056225]|uniref:DUF3888 domain-containing protein n=1 Tax=Gottfriedia sp. NPDC056225 TaxID=3345751 RepID=UPI0035DA1288